MSEAFLVDVSIFYLHTLYITIYKSPVVVSYHFLFKCLIVQSVDSFKTTTLKHSLEGQCLSSSGPTMAQLAFFFS